MKQKFYPEINQNLDNAKIEEEILQFWQEQKIFEKSIEIRNFSSEIDEDNTSPIIDSCALKDHKNCRHSHAEKNEFVFYDGPPFANGLPHYGHLLTGFIKDLVARYQTMKGKKVERRFGWDTHGLPVEMETEKELTKSEGKPISGQIAIQEFGIEKFNDACQKSVMKYANEWEHYVTRQGRFVDFKNSYKTMDLSFMESVLWAFKTLYDKGLLYEDLRVMPYSWACQTPLSNFETQMDNSYRQKASKTVKVKFYLNELPNFLQNLNIPFGKVALVAWTTTPWTLPSNLALAVGEKIEYVALRTNKDSVNEILIIAKDLVEKFAKDLGEFEELKTFQGTELLGLKYQPLFPYFIKNLSENGDLEDCFKILHGDFVATDQGTGIVHIAPGFGEDDQLLCKAHGIPTICPVDEGGKFTDKIFDIEITAQTSSPFGVYGCGEGDALTPSPLRGSWTLQTPSPLRESWNLQTPSPLRGEGWGEGEKIKNLTHLAKNLRKNDTDLENKLWQALKNRQIDDCKFRRQHQIGNYIVDFVCLEKALIIELDGSQHGFAENIEYDKSRTIFLEKEGFKVLRFWNNEVYENFEGVCETIWYELKNSNAEKNHSLKKNNKVISTLTPTLSPQGRGSSENPTPPQGREGLENPTPPQLKNFLSLKNRQVFDTNDDIIKYLKEQKLIFGNPEQILHNYPHCWRTDTPLIYKAMGSWYVKVTAFKDHMLELNQQINWIPNNIKDGQFGKWLENARDWSISRNRFWGCPVPVWKSKSGKIKVFGSIAELEKISGQKITNLHRPFIDEVKFTIDGEEYSRVSDVLDCWFESGSMPYAQVHYPFENKEWFEENFPADFITEYVAQTRGWFYTLMVLSTAIFDRAPFKNVICHGTILDENAQKLSKRLRNYADPLEIFSTLGSDAMRFYMISQPVMRGQELKIDKEGKAIRDVLRLSIKPLFNAFNFFCLYANADGIKARRLTLQPNLNNILDRYILAKLKIAIQAIDNAMSNYDTPTACEEFNKFFEVLNNWYIRRSRQRFWKSEIDQDKQEAYDVLYTILLNICEASAPILPFSTEYVWKNLSNETITKS